MGYRVQVAFGAHAFTREVEPGDTPDLLFMDGNQPRTFSVDRYAHSLHLPAAIAAAVHGDVCLSRNTMVLNTTLPGLAGPYLVVFNLRAVKGKRFDARLDVRSAHHRPNLDPSLPRAKFQVVVANVINGKPIRWSKK
ncbi:MAG TPA: hypothetical protein VF727_02415 [Allosphingosinicella sp.]